jgi:acyl-coenzyme A thioesterase PaaI-like protein
LFLKKVHNFHPPSISLFHWKFKRITIPPMEKLQPTLKQLPEHGSCFLCGSENPHNPGLCWYVDEKGAVSSEFTLTLAQQGPPGHAHGGLSAAVLDEVMGAAVWQAGYMVAAARIEVNYRKPVPLGELIQTRGCITRRVRRKIYTRGEIYLPSGTLLVEGKGLFVIAPGLFEGTNMFRHG